jgi:SIR2-like domain/TIR domain
MRVFISYRRSDASSASRQLATELKARFGPEDVFLDTLDMTAGVEWKTDTIERVRTSDVVLAVIGPQWVTTADSRARRGALDPAEDVVRLEIETAFTNGAMVIPVLVDEATMPARESLPRPFRPLADVQAQTLRHTSWDRDVDALAEALDHLARRASPPEAVRRRAARLPARPAQDTNAERIACRLAEGTVVTVLGSCVNTAGRDAPWQQGAGMLPDAAELARHLARRFGVVCEGDDLARVSEHVSLTEGRVDLNRALRELLVKSRCAPGAVHDFVARVPGLLREAGRERYQMVITPNYDAAVEQALEAAHEPFDLVVFMAAGEHRGRFVHVRWWDPEAAGARPILVPNEYVDLPMDEDGELARTVVVKLHGGAADLGPGWPAARDNFVVTEDDHIAYLTESPVESLVPLQILNKVRDSHFLFLGYRMRDWSLRVFLQRVWGEQQLGARSWAVDPGLDSVERGLWEQRGVTVVDESPTAFLSELERELERFARATAEW